MRKKIATLLVICLCALACGLPVAADNRVPELEIDVALRRDGSAAVTQVWTADTDEGTEFYLACRDSGYLSITDFAVSDENGSYAYIEDWDVDASFEEKAGKCGINETGDGVELCWGISEYGHHRYTISYVLHDLVGAYEDADGFNHRFVDEMGTFPTGVSLTIRREDGAPLIDEECDIWAFGYDGDIWFEDGVIRAQSGSDLESGQHMTIMLSVEKGILAPRRQAEGVFESVKEQALEGSDYGYEDEELTPMEILIALLSLVLTGGLIVLGIVLARAWNKARMKRRMEQVEYFRDAPNNGNLNVTHRLGAACKLCREDALLGAYLLRLISDGALEPEERAGSSQANLRLVRPPRNGNPYDDAFYTILEAAAGADRLLQAKELERFCDQNSKPLARFVDSCLKDADRELARGGCVKSSVSKGVKGLTPQGRQQLDEILGLKRYLLDFSLIHEREVKETVIWQDCLIYAHLLGIADKVAPQIRKLYPDDLPGVERFERCIGYAGYYNSYLYRASERERQYARAARRSGSGGRASIGGGGGFSGGGGGGTR